MLTKLHEWVCVFVWAMWVFAPSCKHETFHSKKVENAFLVHALAFARHFEEG
jgi:hypothetical protein